MRHYILGLVTVACGLLTGCVSSTLHKPLPKQVNIGVMSIMGQANFAPSNHTSINTHQKNALASLHRLHTYSHDIGNLNFDHTLTHSIATALKNRGYTHVSEVQLGSNQSPVAAVHAHPKLDVVVVVSPDEGQAPSYNVAEKNSDLLYGYGSYFQDKMLDHHTFGYANYDISVYDAKNLDILASKFYAQSTKLPFSPWTGNYTKTNPNTLAHLQSWLTNTVTQTIEHQAIQTLRV